MGLRRMSLGAAHRVVPIWAAIVLLAFMACGEKPPVGPSGPDTVVSSIGFSPAEGVIGIIGGHVGVRALARNQGGETLYGSYFDPARFTWQSSAPDVAAVSRQTHPVTGGSVFKVTGLEEGTAIISSTSEGVTGTMIVNVQNRARVAWSFLVPEGPINGGTVIGHDGTIFIPHSDPAADRTRWYAVSPQGQLVWSQDLPFTGRSLPAVGSDGTLYVGSRTGSGLAGFTGRLIAVAPTGTVRWMLEGIDGIRSSPAIGPDGTIYVAGGQHVYAVDPQGEIVWTYERDDDVFVFSSPAIAADGTVYVGGYDYNLHAISPDGSPMWTFKTGNVIQSSPAIGVDGTIYFGSMDGRLYAVSSAGSELWSLELDFRGVPSSPAIGADGVIYLGAGGVFAVDPGGSIRWNYGGPSLWVTETPVVGADGTIYSGTSALNSQSRLLWDYPASGGAPSINHDGAIILTAGHELVAIVENSSANGGYTGSPWPTARGNRLNNGRAGG